jgi:glycosyltransferase involved in cell wall biosynthesis
VTYTKVMRVITRLNIGGPARQEVPLTGVLVARGQASHLVWGAVSWAEGELTLAQGTANTHVPELRRELRPAADVRAEWKLERLMRAGRPQVVHTHMAKAGALGRLAARRTGVPVVVHTFHGHVLEGYFSEWKSRALLATERGLARMTDALVAVSPAVRDELFALGIGRPSQWRVIPLGLDLHDLLCSEVDRTQAREALGVHDASLVVGIVGRLVPIKDHVTFLDAATRIAHDRSDVTFVVVGDGELRSELEVRARRLLGDRCRFLGWVMDLPTLYAALDVVVLTSRNEGTPVALIEAGAASKPTVATRVGGVADVVQDGKTGLLVPPGDPRAVAAGISALVDDPDRARALGKAARRETSPRFTIERLADDLSRLYGELLARKASGPERDRPSRR